LIAQNVRVAKFFILTALVAGLALSGCATMQATQADPKAPEISLDGLYNANGFRLDPVNGVYTIKSGIGMNYGLRAFVVSRTDVLVKIETRLSWWGGPWQSGSIGFKPYDLTKTPECCTSVYSGWGPSDPALRTPGVSPGVKALQPKAGQVFAFDFGF